MTKRKLMVSAICAFMVAPTAWASSTERKASGDVHFVDENGRIVLGRRCAAPDLAPELRQQAEERVADHAYLLTSWIARGTRDVSSRSENNASTGVSSTRAMRSAYSSGGLQPGRTSRRTTGYGSSATAARSACVHWRRRSADVT